MEHAWTCRCCGKSYDTLPLSFAYEAPRQWVGLSDAERQERAKLDSDVCVIDEHIFVRGCLEIPIIGSPERFVWGVWASVSQASFARMEELWDSDVPAEEPPLFGWLCNTIGIYPDTLSLKTSLRLRGGGLRPLIELQPADHPLAAEQRDGISIARVEEIVAALVPGH